MKLLPIPHFLSIIIILVVGIVCIAAKKDMPELEEYINYKLQRDHRPGLAVALVHGKNIVWSKGSGYADLELQKKVMGKTIFGTASITKSFTAAAIFQLFEKTLVNIDDPVDKYLPFQVR